MVSMKTKSALIAEINELIGAVGDKFDADEDGDAERDFMARALPDAAGGAVRSLPTLSMHLLAAHRRRARQRRRAARGPVS